MSENKDIQGKSTQIVGLKKSIHKSVLKDGEYHHLKNGMVSSFEGDMPFIQNAPSNLECLQLPKGFVLIGSKYIKENNFHLICLVNPTTNASQIVYFYPDSCTMDTRIDNKCLGFSVNHPIKISYKYKNCNLYVSLVDGNNRDRYINMDNPPKDKYFDPSSKCYKEIEASFACDKINIQNDLVPPVVKISNVIESGALSSGVYQFAVCYANINGDEQSSYYSKTNIVPIFQDRFGGYETVEGSKANQLTDKAIVVNFSNLDVRYNYINLAVIKTVQGTPTYELVATLPISTEEYIYTGREVTKLLSIDKLLTLYPDYYNSKTVTTANNYLIRANMSTQDETNYQPLANLIELEWVVVRKKADTFETTYKNPTNTTDYLGYQRGEIYSFGIQFLLSNGRKTSVFHIPGRKAKASDLVKYTKDTIPSGESCNFYEFTDKENCSVSDVSELYHWQVYDTATIRHRVDESILDKCSTDVVAYGDFAYWESTDNYPCNEEVYGSLAGTPIRHHKFPSNNTIHHHNSPYDWSVSGVSQAFENENTFIYPIGIRLKNNDSANPGISKYIKQVVQYGILTQEEADLIVGYEIVRGDRTGNKSIIAKGLLYNMRTYTDINASTGQAIRKYFPNYPFNDLRPDPYLTNAGFETSDFATITVDADGSATYKLIDGDPLLANGGDVFLNPYVADIILSLPNGLSDYTPLEPFTIIYRKHQGMFAQYYSARFNFYGSDRDYIDDFTAESDWTPNLSPLDTYEKDVFTFHSPDTHFKQPFLGQELNLHSVEYGSSRGRFDKVEGHPFLKPAIVSKSANYACAFKSIGDYNNFKPISKTNLRRSLRQANYLLGNSSTRFQDDDTIINNRFRESSVGLKLNCDLTDPSIEDESRYTVGSDDKCECKIKTDDKIIGYKDSFEIDSQCSEDYKWISSYYGSLKNYIPNQYGQIDTLKYCLTGKYNNVYDRNVIFGGDTFITRFSLKRKNAFFSVNFIGMSPVGMTYRDAKYHNVLSPRFYVTNERGGILTDYVIDGGESILDCTKGSATPGGSNNGFFYLFSTGIVNFFVESSINTELRYSGANLQDTWYPKLKNTTWYDWMEELKVSINLDNTYLYNFDYSKQNTEEALFPQAADFKPNSKCKNTHPRRIVYSKQDNEESSADNWLVFPANNYYDVDSNLGAIVDVQALDSQRVLVRCENGSQIFNAFDTLQLQTTSVTLGTGGMFANRPMTFAETDTGYAGSISKWVMDTSQFGSFFLDYPRGKVFQYTGQLEEISNLGMFDWFANNLSLKFEKILNKIPNNNLFNKDNPYYTVGYTSIFDNRFNLWFLTKKDYILKNDKDIKYLSIDSRGNLLFKDKLNNFNSSIWKECGWTISYSPIYKSWISYHSFLPNFYLDGKNEFFSGKDSIFKHWDKTSFQKYYNIPYPFEFTITTSKEQLTSILQSIEYNLKVQKYLNGDYQDLYENHNINFNKAIISTDNQSSGLLNLIKKDNMNPYQSIQYPKVNSDSLDILYSKIEGHKYRINQFADLVLDKNNNIPIFLNDENGVDKVPNNIDYSKINTFNNQKFRNEFFDITLINDKVSEYKFILKSLINKTLKSLR